jgi:FMN phosphatase YigB (HAD superfamily)
MATVKPEVLLFDCGGTLSWPPLNRLDEVLRDLRGQTIGVQAQYRAFARGTHALDDYLREHHGAYPVADSFTLNHWVYEEGIAREGFPGLWTRDCTMEIMRRDKRLGKWDFTFPWVREALERFLAAGFRLGLVSNSDGQVAQLLRELDYAKYFETIVDSYVEQVYKPDPRIFYLALDRMGLSEMVSMALRAADGEGICPPVCYIGDTWRSDYEGAIGAGLHVRLIDPLLLYKVWTGDRVRDVSAWADELCG